MNAFQHMLESTINFGWSVSLKNARMGGGGEDTLKSELMCPSWALFQFPPPPKRKTVWGTHIIQEVHKALAAHVPLNQPCGC